MKTNTYQDLTVWQLCMDLVVECHHMTRYFPSIDRSDFEKVLIQSAMMLPAYVADAHARGSASVYLENIGLALGTVARVETYVMLADRLGFCSDEQRKQLVDRLNSIRWLLIRLRKSFQRPGVTGDAPVG